MSQATLCLNDNNPYCLGVITQVKSALLSNAPRTWVRRAQLWGAGYENWSFTPKSIVPIHGTPNAAETDDGLLCRKSGGRIELRYNPELNFVAVLPVGAGHKRLQDQAKVPGFKRHRFDNNTKAQEKENAKENDHRRAQEVKRDEIKEKMRQEKLERDFLQDARETEQHIRDETRGDMHVQMMAASTNPEYQTQAVIIAMAHSTTLQGILSERLVADQRKNAIGALEFRRMELCIEDVPAP